MHRVILSAALVLVSLAASAKGTFSNHENQVTDGYNFILYEPDSATTALPLIITLHSRGSAGTDLADVDIFGTIDALHSGLELDAVVLAPQATGDQWDVEKIINTADWVLSNRNIDPDRVYAIGMSMGGNGVADLAAAYPDRLAAAIVLAGAITKGDVANLNKLPLWVIRGKKDREEAIARTDWMIKEMRSQPDKAPRLVYSKVKGLDHRQHERILYMPYFYEWLLSHNLANPNRPVNTTIDVTTKLLDDSYKGLNLRDNSAAKRQRSEHRRRRGENVTRPSRKVAR